MNSTPFPRPLRGIIPPLPTPLHSCDVLDVAGLERLIEHILAGAKAEDRKREGRKPKAGKRESGKGGGSSSSPARFPSGVAGLFILGTTGEAPSLSYRLRRELIERTCQLVRGRVPVLVGITDTSFIESIELARFAAASGARAVVAATPYYLPPSQPELIEYLEHLVRELPLPLFLYNMPTLTKVSFAPETVERALDLEGVIGLKDSSGDMMYFQRILELAQRRPDWSVLMGPETLTAAAVLMGGHGGVNGGANVHPRLYVDLVEAATAHDVPRTLALHAQVQRIAESLYTVGRHPSAVLKGIKCALSLMGICADGMAEPFQSFRKPERQIIAERLRELGLLKE